MLEDGPGKRTTTAPEEEDDSGREAETFSHYLAAQESRRFYIKPGRTLNKDLYSCNRF